MRSIQPSAESGVFHGEGAFWDAAAKRLRYVDMLAGDVMTLGDTAHERTHVGDVAAIVRARTGGGYVVATERGFVLLDPDLEVEQRIEAFTDDGVRMNEGACDARGRFYAGTMAYDQTEGAGRLYRLDPDLSVHVVKDGVTVPNGLVWVNDDTVALHCESSEDLILARAFDLSTGEFGADETFVDCSDLDGSPDGAALDAEGGLWVAMFGGSAVRRFDAEGKLSDTITLPTPNVTSCAFGGADGQTLYITTSKEGLDDPDPLAARVFSVDVGIGGAPVHPFAG